MGNKNREIGFHSAVFHLCQRALVPLLQIDRGQNTTISIYKARENRQSTSYNFGFFQYCIQFGLLLDNMRELRSLGYYVVVTRSQFLSIWPIRVVVT